MGLGGHAAGCPALAAPWAASLMHTPLPDTNHIFTIKLMIITGIPAICHRPYTPISTAQKEKTKQYAISCHVGSVDHPEQPKAFFYACLIE